MFNLEKDENLGEGKESVEEYTIKIVASIAKYLTGLGVSIEVISHAEKWCISRSIKAKSILKRYLNS
jgi:hypothetical protein